MLYVPADQDTFEAGSKEEVLAPGPDRAGKKETVWDVHLDKLYSFVLSPVVALKLLIRYS